MAIKQPSEIAAKGKKIRMIIAGFPGLGKSTLALSAPKPLHIDVDRGIDRVPAIYRKPYIQPADYNELLNDLKPDNIADFETLVIDTGGQLIKLMSTWAISNDPKNGKRDGTLSLQGYGVIGREFERLMNKCYYELNKHVVVVFHAKEDKDGDNTRLRLLVEGQTKDNVWQPMDLGGFMEMQGDKRIIGFTNCERYYGKGTHGINGIYQIPELKDNASNDFLTRLFGTFNDNIMSEAALVEEEREMYETAINDVKDILENISSPEEATEAVNAMKNIEHALTSEKETRSMFAKRIKELGFILDKEKGVYTCKTDT